MPNPGQNGAELGSGRRPSVRWELDWGRSRHHYEPSRHDSEDVPVVINARRSVYAQLIRSMNETYFATGAFDPDAGERMGLLLGTVGRGHGDREWVINISAVYEVPHVTTSQIHASMDTREVHEIARQAKRQTNTEDVVGWFHTHPGMDLFLSPTDLQTFAGFFPEPWQAAMVIDPERFAAAYFVRNREGKPEKEQADWREFDLRAEAASKDEPGDGSEPTSAARSAGPAASSFRQIEPRWSLVPEPERGHPPTSPRVRPNAKSRTVVERPTLATRFRFYAKQARLWQWTTAVSVAGVLALLLLGSPLRARESTDDSNAMLTRLGRYLSAPMSLEHAEVPESFEALEGGRSLLAGLLGGIAAQPGTRYSIESDDGRTWALLGGVVGDNLTVLTASVSTSDPVISLTPEERLSTSSPGLLASCGAVDIGVRRTPSASNRSEGSNAVVERLAGDCIITEVGSDPVDRDTPVEIRVTGVSATVLAHLPPGARRPDWCDNGGHSRLRRGAEREFGLYAVPVELGAPFDAGYIERQLRFRARSPAARGPLGCHEIDPPRTIVFDLASSPAGQAALAEETHRLAFVRRRPDGKYDELPRMDSAKEHRDR